MAEDPVHRRRPRYSGSHPRRFDEKYKELAPEKYPGMAAHVRAQGKTPAGQHVPIMVDEVLAALAPMPGERGVDATLGWGGHAERILWKLQPGGSLLGLDADPIELPKTAARLSSLGFGDTAFIARRTNFAALQAVMAEVGWADGADFVFADLGVSSMQLDDPARGFSLKWDGPLDMRMNPQRGPSAAEWLARASVDTLTAAFEDTDEYEPDAQRIAEALVEQRGRLTTTQALARAVREGQHRHVSERDAEVTVRRIFQAIRIAVNDEYGALEALLRQLPACLKPGGRAAILTFHSGEDRRVKKAFDQGLRDGAYSSVSREIARASAAERRANPRSTSAKLRWARR